MILTYVVFLSQMFDLRFCAALSTISVMHFGLVSCSFARINHLNIIFHIDLLGNPERKTNYRDRLYQQKFLCQERLVQNCIGL